MKYWYLQANDQIKEGVWVEVSREFFSDSTWKEVDTYLMETLFQQSAAHSIIVSTNYHSFRITKPRKYE